MLSLHTGLLLFWNICPVYRLCQAESPYVHILSYAVVNEHHTLSSYSVTQKRQKSEISKAQTWNKAFEL